MSTIIETFGPGQSFVVVLPSEEGFQITAEVGPAVQEIADDTFCYRPDTKRVRLTLAGATALRAILSGTWTPPVEVGVRVGIRSTPAQATAATPRALPATDPGTDDDTL